MAVKKKDPPQPGTIWDRIERARGELEWNESQMGEYALGQRTHYSLIGKRGWNADPATINKIVDCLTARGFSEVWLRVGIPPERSDKKALHADQKLSAKLRLLGLKLSLKYEQLVELWTDLDLEGPLERFSEEVQRAAFAAAYLENRSLEDVRLAVFEAQRGEAWLKGRGADHYLMQIRFALSKIKAADSGSYPRIALVRRKDG